MSSKLIKFIENSGDFKVLNEYHILKVGKDEILNDYVPLMNHGFCNGTDLIDMCEDDLLFKYQLNTYAHLIETFKIDTNNKVILDLGCGYGRGIDFLRRKYNFKKTYGLDLFAHHTAIAKIIHPKNEFITIDARNINLLNLKVDILVSVESVQYYARDKNFLQGLYNLLNDNGVAIMTCFFNDFEVNEVFNNFKKIGFNVEMLDVTDYMANGSEKQLELFPKIREKYKLNDRRYDMETYALKDSAYNYRNKIVNYTTFCLKK